MMKNKDLVPLMDTHATLSGVSENGTKPLVNSVWACIKILTNLNFVLLVH